MRDSILPLVTKCAPATVEELRTLCENIYKRDGFVKWTEVAELLGASRQAIFNRLNVSVAKGQLTEAEVERWRSFSRRALTRKNEQLRREQEKLRISVTLTSDNKRWLAYNSQKEHCTTSDIINGLINRAREAEYTKKIDYPPGRPYPGCRSRPPADRAPPLQWATKRARAASG